MEFDELSLINKRADELLSDRMDESYRGEWLELGELKEKLIVNLQEAGQKRDLKSVELIAKELDQICEEREALKRMGMPKEYNEFMEKRHNEKMLEKKLEIRKVLAVKLGMLLLFVSFIVWSFTRS